MLWNVITVLLVILCLVVLTVGFPGVIGKRTKWGVFRMPPPRRRDEREQPRP